MFSASLAAQAPEFDLGRVIFIIMLLVGGFLQWLSNWWKRKQAEAKAMRKAPPTPEELQARERAWQRQTGAGEQPPLQPAARNPLEDLLKTLRELSAPEEAEAQRSVVQPPPLPQTVPVAEPPRPRPAPPPVPAAPPAVVLQRPRHPIAAKMGDLGGLRQAVVFREVLGPPKALQTVDDHLI